MTGGHAASDAGAYVVCKNQYQRMKHSV